MLKLLSFLFIVFVHTLAFGAEKSSSTFVNFCPFKSAQDLAEKADASLRDFSTMDLKRGYFFKDMSDLQTEDRIKEILLVADENLLENTKGQKNFLMKKWYKEAEQILHDLLGSQKLGDQFSEFKAYLDVANASEKGPSNFSTFGDIRFNFYHRILELLYRKNGESEYRFVVAGVLAHEIAHSVNDAVYFKRFGSLVAVIHEPQLALENHMLVDAIGMRLSQQTPREFARRLSETVSALEATGTKSNDLSELRTRIDCYESL